MEQEMSPTFLLLFLDATCHILNEELGVALISTWKLMNKEYFRRHIGEFLSFISHF